MLIPAWQIDFLCTVADVRYREWRALTFRHCEGDSLAAIAAQMETTVDAVKQLLVRGRGRIRTWRDQQGEDEESGWSVEATERPEDPEPEGALATEESLRGHAAHLRLAIGDRSLTVDQIVMALRELLNERDWEAAHPWQNGEVVRVGNFCGQRITRVDTGAALAL